MVKLPGFSGADMTPEKVAELKKKAKDAQAEYEKASGEKEKADAKKIRCGEYQISEDSPQRPFVYVPKDFDLNAQGAIGQVLEALGVKKALGQTAPSMVLRVSIGSGCRGGKT